MSEHQPIPFAVVIVNYGSPDLLAANLDPSLDPAADAQVIVVDNFSTSEARESAERLCRTRGWALVTSPNRGFGAGVNLGVAAARDRGCEEFVLLNPDAVVSAEVLRELALHVRLHPDALVSPSMDTGDGHPHFRGAQVHRLTGQMRSSWSPADSDPEWKNWLSGACLALGAGAFDRLGGLDEKYFLYWEDVDLSRRAAALGLRLDLREDLLVVHDEGGTHTVRDSRAKSPLYYYFNVRNRLLFGRRMLRGKDWRRWLLATPRQSWLILLRGGRKQMLFQPRGAWAALRGLRAGLVRAALHPRREADSALRTLRRTLQ